MYLSIKILNTVKFLIPNQCFKFVSLRVIGLASPKGCCTMFMNLSANLADADKHRKNLFFLHTFFTCHVMAICRPAVQSPSAKSPSVISGDPNSFLWVPTTNYGLFTTRRLENKPQPLRSSRGFIALILFVP